MSTARIKGSIRRRLLLTLVAGAMILALVLYFVFQSLAIELAEESQDNILRASATAILDAAAITEGELDLDLPYSSFSMLSNISNDRVFYAIRADGDFITGYDDLPFPQIAVSDAPIFVTSRYQEDSIRLVIMSRFLSTRDGPLTLTIALAQTQGGQSELIKKVLRVSAYLGGGVFLLVVILAILSARTTISPLVRLAESVERRGPKELRPVAAPVPVEMAPLVSSLNMFMERLATSLSRTEEFIADAAHRLRTPLAIVRTRAEATLLRVEKAENREALKDMIRALDESSRAASQMLDHAMVTLRADDLERSAVDLSALVHELVERIGPTAELREITFNLKTPDKIIMQGDPILLQSALRNILDNALKFSPEEGQISLTLDVEDSFARVNIVDQGGGFPEEDIDQLTQRFKRGKNAAGTVGSGLGLTISADVAAAHGGQLIIEHNAAGGGACVTLLLPLH